MARALSNCSQPQLAKIQPYLHEAVLDAVHISRRIKAQNQGRLRQDKLVGKLIRTEHSEEEILRISVRFSFCCTPSL